MEVIRNYDKMYEHLKNEHGIQNFFLTSIVKRNRIAYNIKPSSEGFEGQASGCEKAEKPRDEGS